MEQQLFSVTETGAILGYGKTKTHELINRGLLEAKLVDGILKVTAEGIEKFLRNLEPANKHQTAQADRHYKGEPDQRADHAQKQRSPIRSARARKARRG
jgi:hypothetical protein